MQWLLMKNKKELNKYDNSSYGSNEIVSMISTNLDILKC